jgi:hypothetical protein
MHFVIPTESSLEFSEVLNTPETPETTNPNKNTLFYAHLSFNIA